MISNEIILTIIIIILIYNFYKNILRKQKPLLISIEGNIGVGKSTLTKIISQLLKNECEIIYEPVDLWQSITDLNKKNILQLFYDDKTKWAFTFQMIAGLSIIQKLTNILMTTNKKYIFLDRSFLTTKYTFEKMLYDDNIINTIEHSTYNMLCNHYDNTIKKDYKHIHIYLKCEPNICFERIKKRNRCEESNISLEYLQKLNKYHDEWLLKNDDVLIIDCNNDTLDNISWYKNIIKNINIKL
jgi:deoxyadenosine/deoxycytidine kinase